MTAGAPWTALAAEVLRARWERFIAVWGTNPNEFFVTSTNDNGLVALSRTPTAAPVLVTHAGCLETPEGAAKERWYCGDLVRRRP
ncbi:MAG: hypothetical protein ABW217_22595 [Polyangiaceae bacterium]